MENDEESDISMEFGRVMRMALGSTMQVAETKARQATQLQQMQEQSAQQAQREIQSKLAWNLNLELKNPSFASMSGEQIADRMTVASQLAPNFPNAAKAYMAGSDRLRNDLGINVEDINRDHPLSAEDRHAALRNAVDDYYASLRTNEESKESQQQDKDSEQSNDERQASNDPVAEADSTQSTERLEAESAEAKESSEAQTVLADRSEGETNLDERHTDAQESKQAQQTQEMPNVRPEVSPGQHVETPTHAPAALLARQRAKAGFPQGVRHALGQNNASRPARQSKLGQQRNAQKVSEVSR